MLRLKSRIWITSKHRFFSSSSSSIENLSNNNKNETNNFNKDEESTVLEHQTWEDSSFSNYVEPIAIQSLNIVGNIEKMSKPGSLFYQYFCGSCDKDLLSYPFMLKTRKEFLQMTEQYEMIRHTWNKIDKKKETLDLLGYNSLYKLSVSEMMCIFEAIGASVQKQMPFGTMEDQFIRQQKRMARQQHTTANADQRWPIGEAAWRCFDAAHQTAETVLPLIVHNSLVYYAINNSSNVDLRESLFNEQPNIGLALREPSVNQTNDIENWQTEAKLTYDSNNWVVSGQKCQVLNGDYSHYMVFCRTKNFTDKQVYTGDEQESSGFVTLLLPADQVKVRNDYIDQLGVQYQHIQFEDVQVSRQTNEVMKAQQDMSQFLNVKGCGQLASSALILGILKQLLKNTYAHLVNDKLGLTQCELVQYKLFQATSKIYSIESMLYITAAMYDSFESDSCMVNESFTVKALTTEYAYFVIQELRNIFGSRFPFASITQDLICLLDSFLGSSIHNRIWLGQQGAKYYKTQNALGEYKKHKKTRITSIHSLKTYLKFRKLRKYGDLLTHEMNKYVHHNLHVACDWIESCLNRLDYGTNDLHMQHAQDLMYKHNDLNRLATLSMEIFMMISVLSRANHALCYGIRNGDAEKELCLAICKDTLLKHLQMFEDIIKESCTDNDNYAENIFKHNLEEKGYFSPLFRL